MENKDINRVLDSLATVLQQCGTLQQVYLGSGPAGIHQPAKPATSSSNGFRYKEGALPLFLQAGGLRSMTVVGMDDLDTELAAAAAIADQEAKAPGSLLRHPGMVGHLQNIFQHACTVAFADWALFASASDCWDALLTQVIKPAKRKDHEFIFYLGDISGTPVFLVDEMIDIIGEYARYGKVTFILDQQEMLRLWQGLNGVRRTSGDSWPFDYEEKYRALFNAMNIHDLVVYAANGVSLYAKDQRFNLNRRILPGSIENSGHARNDFINGYSMGLSLRLDIAQCIALGIVYYSARGEYKDTPNREMLLNYIRTWQSLA